MTHNTYYIKQLNFFLGKPVFLSLMHLLAKGIKYQFCFTKKKRFIQHAHLPNRHYVLEFLAKKTKHPKWSAQKISEPILRLILNHHCWVILFYVDYLCPRANSCLWTKLKCIRQGFACYKI